MYQEVLPEKALNLIDDIAGKIRGLYLAGGTGLALQLRHRGSEDLHFFSTTDFDAQDIQDALSPNIETVHLLRLLAI